MKNRNFRLPKFKLVHVGLLIGLAIGGNIVLKLAEPFIDPILTNWSTEAAQKRLDKTIAEMDAGKGELKAAPMKIDTDLNGESTGTAINKRTRVLMSFNCSTQYGLLSLLESPGCKFKEVDFNNARGTEVSGLQTAVFRGSDGEVAEKNTKAFMDALGLKGTLTKADSVPGDGSNFNLNLVLDDPITLPNGTQTSLILIRADKKWSVFGKYKGGATPTVNIGGAKSSSNNNQKAR
jgi:hypothetical protein